MRLRLSLLMFLQYAAPGAILPLFTLRLKELDFSSREIGVACAMQSLACILAPLVIGQVADRWFSSERCIAVCSLSAGVLFLVLAELTEPWAICAATLALWLVMVPALTLGVSLSLTHLPRPERQFGPVRLWGTVGWVASGWVVGWWFSQQDWLIRLLGLDLPARSYADAFRLGGVLALALSAYALTLPHTPPTRSARSLLAPLAALGLCRNRAFAVYVVCNLGVSITIAFSFQLTPLLLAHLGISQEWLPPTLTIAQAVEVLALALLPMFFLRLGLKGTMLLGLATWVLALGILTAGAPTWLVVGSLALNGLNIACFYVAGQVFVNREARGDFRVSAQGLVSMTNGVGQLVGNLLVAEVRAQTGDAFSPAFAVGATIALALVAIFWIGFVEDSEAPASPRAEFSEESASDGALQSPPRAPPPATPSLGHTQNPSSVPRT